MVLKEMPEKINRTKPRNPLCPKPKNKSSKNSKVKREKRSKKMVSKKQVTKRIKKMVETRAREYIRVKFEKNIKRRIEIMVRQSIRNKVRDTRFSQLYPISYANTRKKQEQRKKDRRSRYTVDHTFNLNGWGLMSGGRKGLMLDGLRTSVEQLRVETAVQGSTLRTVRVQDMIDLFERFMFTDVEVLQMYTKGGHGFSSYALLSEVFEVFDHRYKFLMSKSGSEILWFLYLRFTILVFECNKIVNLLVYI